MLPKKKSAVGMIIGLAAILIVAFLALHGAAAHMDVQNSGESYEGLGTLTAFMEAFQVRLETPLSIEWNESSPLWVGMSAFVCFIVIVQVTSTKRKTIAGKEHGTAKWSTQADIRDLFAANILKGEIQKITRARFFITRYFLKRKIMKECEKIGAAEKADALNRLKNSPWNNKKHRKSEIDRINKETKAFIQSTKMEAWLPYKLKIEHRNLIKELKSGNLLIENNNLLVMGSPGTGMTREVLKKNE